MSGLQSIASTGSIGLLKTLSQQLSECNVHSVCLTSVYLQVAVLKEQPGILRVSPMSRGGPLPYQGFAQDPLVLMPGCWLVTPLQSTLGNPSQRLLPDGQGGGA